MTPAHQQQQEYIITDEELNGIVWSNFMEQRRKLEEVIRSRPHTSPPAPAHDCFDCPTSICKYPSLRSEQIQSRFDNQRKMYEARIQAAAKAEREQIIKMLESWNPFQRTFGSVLESLRSQQEPQQ